jgi:hypothetical protein
MGGRLCGDGGPFVGREVCVKTGVLAGLTGTVVGSLEDTRLLIAIQSDQHALFLAIDQSAIYLDQEVL